MALFDGLKAQTDKAMQGHEVHNYLAAVMDAVSEANRYFASEEPWALKKENPERMGTVLYVTAELVRQAAILLQPVIPAGASQFSICWISLKNTAILRVWVPIIASPRASALPTPQGVFPRLSMMEDGADS